MKLDWQHHDDEHEHDSFDEWIHEGSRIWLVMRFSKSMLGTISTRCPMPNVPVEARGQRRAASEQ